MSHREFGGNASRVFVGGSAMKRFGTVLTVVLPVVVALGLSIAVVGKAIADSCTGCACCNYLYWNSSPTSDDADSNGDFSFSQVVNWGSDDDDGIIVGQITNVSDPAVDNIDSGAVNYTPENFWPYGSCCTGSVTIQTSGFLTNEYEDGTLRTKATIAITSPVRQSTKVVHIESALD